MKIYVGNLPFSMNDETLRNAFKSYGQVKKAYVITDRETKRSRGFGFVEMDNEEEARAAIEGLNGSMVDNRTLRVNEAKPMEERPPQRSANRY